MRNRIIPLLVSLMLLSALAACGSTAAGTGTPETQPTQAAVEGETSTAAEPSSEASAPPTVAPEMSPEAVEEPASSAVAGEAPSSSYPMTVVDDAGRSVTIEKEPRAVVSVAPSNTEIVYALGKEDILVGVSEFDDYPPQVAEKKKIGGGFQPNLEEIMALDPDLILSIGEYPDLVSQLEGKGLTVLVLGPKDLDGILADIELVGKVVGAEGEATKITSEMRSRLEGIADKVKDAERPKVFFEVDATDPTKPFTAGPGSFMDTLIQLAGGENIAANAASQWAQLSSEEIISADPDVIVLGDATVPINPQSAETIAARPGWAEIKAVKNNAIHEIDTNIVSRPGPRIVDGLEALARILHPGLFE